MRLFIEPSDVLLFRSSRPFNAGESGYLESRFPPTPETIQGAIRARIAAYFAAEWQVSLAEAFEMTLEDGSQPLQQLIGDQKSYGAFRLRGLTLGRRDEKNPQQIEQLFPPPAHLQRGEKSEKTIRLIPKALEQGVFTNMPTRPAGSEQDNTSVPLLPLQPERGDPKEKLEDFKNWLTLAELDIALGSDAAQIEGIEGVSEKDLYDFEPRLGIGLSNATKTTRDGLLYQMSFVRLKAGVGFVVDVSLEGFRPEAVRKELHLPEKGWLALGGERRAASFEVIDEGQAAPAPAQETCVYFSTPAYFADGWRPEDWLTMFGAQPVGAAVSRAQLIGGWQQEPGSARGVPKRLRRCVPAGSVYFFEQPVKAGPFTDEGDKIGYGIAYKGVWKHV